MLYQIADLLLTITVTIVAGSCLMLCYLDFFRIQLSRVHIILGGQIAHFLLTVTDWITQPLRKIIQNTGKVNGVYLVSGYLVVVAKVVILSLLSQRLLNDISHLLLPILLSSLIEYVELFLSILSGITFIYVALSWLGPNSPSYAVTGKILEPLLGMLRKRMPNTGAFDLTPLILLVLIKVLQIILSNFR